MSATWAVLVNWNGGAATNAAAIDSVLAQGVAPEHVAFVDNASSDGSLEATRERFPDLCYLLNDENLGFGHGANRGIRAALDAGAERVVLVNNDVVIPDGCLAALERRLDEAPEVGVVGPRVLYAQEPGTVWSAGGLLTFRQNLTTMLGHREPDGPAFRTTRRVDYVAGCVLLVRREVLERVGLLDGDYFAYHEDVDFCLQVLEAGWAIECVGEVAAYHDAHTSTGGGYNPRRKYMMGVNTVWFLRRHGTPGRWLRFLVFDVLSLPPLWFREALRGRGAAVRAKALGTWHGLRGRRVSARVLEPGGTSLW